MKQCQICWRAEPDPAILARDYARIGDAYYCHGYRMRDMDAKWAPERQP